MEEDNKTFFQKLILGNNKGFSSIHARMEAILTGELALFGIILYVIYLAIDLVSKQQNLISVYIFNLAVISVLFFMNRSGKTELSKFVLLIITLSTLYLLGSSYQSKTLSYLYYFPLILFAFTVYGYAGKLKVAFFFLVSVLLIFMELAFDFSILPLTIIDDRLASIIMKINLFASLLITFYIGFYFIRTTHLGQKYLTKRQNQLNRITDQLKESDLRYELAMQGSNAGLWDWDIKSNKIFHGTKWFELLGYDKDSFDNASIEHIYDIIHSEDLPRVKEALSNQLEKDIPYSVELRMKKKDGAYRWFLDSGKVIRENDNVPTRMVGSIIDIEERKLAEDEVIKQNELLAKANSELDRFVYITSHDLKAPLLSVMGLINLAQMSDDPNEVEMCLRLMRERIKGLEHFIGDIIDYSRNARSGIISDEIHLQKMVEDILKEMIFVDDADKINITLDIPHEFRFLADSKRLSVILKNLIFNAIKYHDQNKDDPSIHIKASQNGKTVLIHVIDNGIGIDPDIKEKIFDMFYRASEKSKGSGLGLYIVKEMVSKLEGSIEVFSEPMKGTEFRLSFPAAE